MNTLVPHTLAELEKDLMELDTEDLNIEKSGSSKNALERGVGHAGPVQATNRRQLRKR